MSRTRTELVVAIWSAITFGALLASMMVSRPVRDALALAGDPDHIPWLFTGTFVVFLLVVPIWGKAVTKSPRRVVPRAFHVFTLCALVFYALMHSGVAPVTTGYAFYIWSAVFNMLVVSAFWSLLADLFDPTTAKKLYGPISAGGTIGAIVGPLVTRVSLEYIGVADVLLLMVFFLELAALGVHQVRRHGAHLITAAHEQPLPPDPLAGLKALFANRYLAAIAGFVLCSSAAATFVYLAQAHIVHAAFADSHARTEFFASLDLWTQVATLAVQLLLARPLLTWLGPGLVLCVLPLLQGTAIAVLAIAPSLAALAVIQIANRTVQHGLTRPARELLFTVVSRDDKYRAKNVIDTLVLRFGDFGASWIRTGLVAASAGTAVLAVAALPLALVWIALALVLGAGFRRRAIAKETP